MVNFYVIIVVFLERPEDSNQNPEISDVLYERSVYQTSNVIHLIEVVTGTGISNISVNGKVVDPDTVRNIGRNVSVDS